jgi:soluble lytic murein transglycosylase-like protein
MPGTARRFGLDDPLRELLQPELNVAVGAEYLKTLQKRFGNDLSLVLAAYNAGEGAVEKYGRRIPPYPETQAYVRDVLATYAELRRRLGAPTGVAGSV